MKEDRFIVLPKATIRPNKIVFYNQFVLRAQTGKINVSQFSNVEKKELTGMGLPIQIMPDSNSHNFELSKKASSRIREKVSWLYELAKNKSIPAIGNSKSYTFKMNFVTLTLPALQAHATAEITSICLNQFLTECKAKFALANYVWRLEFQKNGNAHYHIATDTFIHYTDCKLIWNRCLRKLGYIQAYQKKFGNMTFEEYRRDFSDNGKVPFNVLRERYGRGCATNWDSPNTVDVRCVGNAKNIIFYISKYITKKSEHSLNPIVATREPATSNLRLWFCSKSLSALDKIEVFIEDIPDLVGKIFSGLKNVKNYVFDYCNLWFFNGKEQDFKVKADIWRLFREYSYSRGYIPAG
jgi:hypothetical protein